MREDDKVAGVGGVEVVDEEEGEDVGITIITIHDNNKNDDNNNNNNPPRHK